MMRLKSRQDDFARTYCESNNDKSDLFLYC